MGEKLKSLGTKVLEILKKVPKNENIAVTLYALITAPGFVNTYLYAEKSIFFGNNLYPYFAISASLDSDTLTTKINGIIIITQITINAIVSKT